MRFEELCLHIPGDELRLRFHDRLTVVSGISALERHGLAESLLGTVTGEPGGHSVLTYLDADGRRVKVTRQEGGPAANSYDDGSPAPSLLTSLGIGAEALRQVCWVQAADLGVISPIAADEPAELTEARAALSGIAEQLESALMARQAVETMRLELVELDERLREAEEGRARRRYARLLAALERVRAEAEAIRGGEAGAAADRSFIETASEAHRLVERWRLAHGLADESRARFGDRQRLDRRTLEEATAIPERAPDELESLAVALDDAEARRDALATRLTELAASQLPDPSDHAVVRLARADQERVWATAHKALDSRLRLEQASLDLGGLETDGAAPALAGELEASHAEVDDAERLLGRRRIPGLLGSVTALAGAVAALPVFPPLAGLALAGAATSGLWGVGLPRRQLARARAREEDALGRAGIPTYLGFQLRRIDATIDPAARQRLDVAALEQRVAMAEWREVAGELGPAEALDLEDEVRAYAEALAGLEGAADEIEAVRTELTTVAEPAVERALGALLNACRPYGIDEPSLAVSMVRHQVTLGVIARRQLELEAAEQEEAALERRLQQLATELGFLSGDVATRISAVDRALAEALERDDARRRLRPREVVDAELAELEARARSEHRDEWGRSIAPDASAEPDVDELRYRREQTARSYEMACRLVPDVEHLADRHSAVQRRVTVLESDLGLTPADEMVDAGHIERYLLARLAGARGAGSQGEWLPVLLDEPFLRIRGDRKLEVLDLVDRLADKVQLVYLTDDADVLMWARRRTSSGTLLLLEPETEKV